MGAIFLPLIDKKSEPAKKSLTRYKMVRVKLAPFPTLAAIVAAVTTTAAA